MCDYERASEDEIREGVCDAWERLTKGQRKHLAESAERVQSDMEADDRLDACTMVERYISDFGLEMIGKKSTVDDINAMGYEDFRTIIED